ncbi:MAG: TMEM165/GDT1 family protein [Thermoprotei archaeon]|nr:TMEM165/GDT1 family protein [Thermoprotei archaeon]
MQIEALTVAFSLVFLAELGDKTQLTVIALSAKEEPLRVLLGAMGAFVLISCLSVLLGNALTAIIPLIFIRALSGLVFIALGLFTLVRSDVLEDGERCAKGTGLLKCFSLVCLMELGDKTQLTTVMISARYGDLLAVTSGVLLAFLAVTTLGVLLGAKLLKKIPKRLLNIASSALFICFGIWFIADVWHSLMGSALTKLSNI